MQTAPTATVYRFAPSSGFQFDLRARVEAALRDRGISGHGTFALHLKAAIVLAWFALSYVGLVFVAQAAWQGVLLSISLGLAMAAVGFNVQHDANHGSFSRRRWVNRVMGSTLELLGGSSFLWRQQHNVLHHTYPNLHGADQDIDIGFFGRVAPDQRWYPIHRYQHLYLVFLYALIGVRWQVADFLQVISGRMGPQRIQRPRGAELAFFLAGKLFLVTVAFVIPMMLHRVWVVLLFYGLTMATVGIVLAVVFQLAHCVEEAAHPRAEPGVPAQRLPVDWAAHQAETSVNFARENPLATWYLGGLNFQLEHHLFPKISHVHYPWLSKIVEQCCRDHGVSYTAHATVYRAIRSHFRFLRTMGRQPAAA